MDEMAESEPPISDHGEDEAVLSGDAACNHDALCLIGVRAVDCHILLRWNECCVQVWPAAEGGACLSLQNCIVGRRALRLLCLGGGPTPIRRGGHEINRCIVRLDDVLQVVLRPLHCCRPADASALAEPPAAVQNGNSCGTATTVVRLQGRKTHVMRFCHQCTELSAPQ